MFPTFKNNQPCSTHQSYNSTWAIYKQASKVQTIYFLLDRYATTKQKILFYHHHQQCHLTTSRYRYFCQLSYCFVQSFIVITTTTASKGLKKYYTHQKKWKIVQNETLSLLHYNKSEDSSEVNELTEIIFKIGLSRKFVKQCNLKKPCFFSFLKLWCFVCQKLISLR